jgi:hypothetical protein
MKVSHWIALVALCLSGTAVAQTSPARSGSSTNASLSNMNAYRELRTFGICFARTERSAALAIIAAPQGSPDEARAMRGTIFGEDLNTNCMGGGDRSVMSTVFARGTVAEGLLLSGGVPPQMRLPAPPPEQVRDLPGAGRCYAAAHETEIRGLLATRIGSDEERAAATALWPGFRPCLARYNLRLNPVWIRYILAEGLLTLAPPSSPPAH